MDYNPPKNFIEFKYGWHRNIDFKNEAELLKDICYKVVMKIIQ